ncbi:hypothetical protein BS47DRAFT_1370007, partial [Hydnum rufescens UP504]
MPKTAERASTPGYLDNNSEKSATNPSSSPINWVPQEPVTGRKDGSYPTSGHTTRRNDPPEQRRVRNKGGISAPLYKILGDFRALLVNVCSGTGVPRGWCIGRIPAQGKGDCIRIKYLRQAVYDEGAKIGKEGNNPLKLNPSIVDAIREELNEIKNTDTLTTGKKALAEENEIIVSEIDPQASVFTVNDLHRFRKLLWLSMQKEPHFSISIEKPKTDLTSGMLATADKWGCPTSSTQSTRETLEYLSRNRLNKWVEIGNGCMFRPEMPELMGLLLDVRVNGIRAYVQLDFKFSERWQISLCPALEDVLVWDIGKKTIGMGSSTVSMWHEIRHRSEMTYMLRSPQKTPSQLDTPAVPFGFGVLRRRRGCWLEWPKKAFTPRYHSKKLVPDWCRVLKIPSHCLGRTGWNWIVPVTVRPDLRQRSDHEPSIWAFAVDNDEDILFTGSGDGELKAWRINYTFLEAGMKETESGGFPLPSRHRVSQIALHPNQPYLAVQSHDRSVEIFRDEVRKKQVRRQKRDEEKGKGEGKSKEGKENGDGGAWMRMPSPQSTKKEKTTPEATRQFSVDMPGHHTDVRTLALSSDDQLLASVFHDTVKSHEGALWSMLVHLDGKALARISKGDRGHSHYLWTASKDKLLKYWGGDKASLRDLDHGHTLARSDAPIGSGVADAQVEGAEAGIVSKQTSDTLMAGERIIEAIEVADHERETFRAYYEVRAASRDPESLPVPGRHAILAAPDISPEMYVLRVVEKVRSTVLFDALLVLPFGKVVSVLEYLNEWALR